MSTITVLVFIAIVVAVRFFSAHMNFYLTISFRRSISIFIPLGYIMEAATYGCFGWIE